MHDMSNNVKMDDAKKRKSGKSTGYGVEPWLKPWEKVLTYWYWICLGALLGYVILFNGLFTIFLSYLKPLGGSQTVVSEERKDKDAKRMVKNSHQQHPVYLRVEARRGCRSSITERDNSDIGFSDHERRFSQMDDAKKRKSGKDEMISLTEEQNSKVGIAHRSIKVIDERR
ncbi:ABC transporter G family member 32 [Tanacetum coccineum]